jgi:hypothetical protein
VLRDTSSGIKAGCLCPVDLIISSINDVFSNGGSCTLPLRFFWFSETSAGEFSLKFVAWFLELVKLAPFMMFSGFFKGGVLMGFFLGLFLV